MNIILPSYFGCGLAESNAAGTFFGLQYIYYAWHCKGHPDASAAHPNPQEKTAHGGQHPRFSRLLHR